LGVPHRGPKRHPFEFTVSYVKQRTMLVKLAPVLNRPFLRFVSIKNIRFFLIVVFLCVRGIREMAVYTPVGVFKKGGGVASLR